MSASVIKAFIILDFIASNGGISLTAVSKKLGTSKSTAFRYLTTFEKLGVVNRDDSDRFTLGPKLIELAGVYLRDNSLRKVTEPFLNQLAEETKETAHLAVPSENEVVYIDKVDSSHSIQMASRIGGRMPMHCTSLGKAILAHSLDQVEEIIDEGLTTQTPNTVRSPEALREELEFVRSKGFSIDDEENELGVRCVGSPIFNHAGKAIGAISVSGPANRMPMKQCRKWGPLVRETAFKISKRMGYRR
jgi:DNA-binding IclR family transcriptional regulator